MWIVLSSTDLKILNSLSSEKFSSLSEIVNRTKFQEHIVRSRLQKYGNMLDITSDTSHWGRPFFVYRLKKAVILPIYIPGEEYYDMEVRTS